MIRPSPTSISLSASDVSAHLRHAEINQGLLKQGFRSHEIRRFYREQNGRVLEEAGISEADLSIGRTWVDLATHHREIAHPSKNCRDISVLGRSSMETKILTPQKTPQTDELLGSIECIGHHSPLLSISQERVGLFASDRHVLSPASSLAASPPATCRPVEVGVEPGRSLHVPRQSSLLRFSSNVSPTYSEEDQEEGQVTSFVPFSPRSTRSTVRYRHRTETYPYEQSEVGDVSSSSSFVSIFETLALDESLVPDKLMGANRSMLRGDAREFTPLAPPPPFDCASQGGSPDIGSSATHDIRVIPRRQVPYTSRIVPSLRSTTESNTRISDTSRRSPPLEIDLLNAGMTLTQVSPELPAMPSTPPIRRIGLSRTEPRAHRNQYLDGPPFVPYNDSLPASIQPQTPADVSRQPFVNEFSAAYTDPPGRLHGHDQSSLLAGMRGMEAGERSPTTQAISMRQRRNREFARGARVEGLRISRLRQQLQAGRAPGSNTQRDIHELWTEGEQHDLWRDDLDADRVGEENFEDLGRLVDTSGMGVRVISGNRRAHGI